MRKPTALLRRIEALEQRRGALANRPVMLVPRLMTCDEWEATAAIQQEILKKNVKTHAAPDYSGLPRLRLVPHLKQLRLR